MSQDRIKEARNLTSRYFFTHSSSSSTKPTPSPTTSATSAPTPTQTTLNNQTYNDANYAMQGFADVQYQGNATEIYREEGFTDLPYNCSSYVWERGASGCCITFCSNTTYSGGYWCDTRYQPKASLPVARFFIWCDQNITANSKKCS